MDGGGRDLPDLGCQQRGADLLMPRIMGRETGRWGLPALALFVVFLLYTGVASIALVVSGAPEVMASAIRGNPDGDQGPGDGVPPDAGEEIEVVPTDEPEAIPDDPRLTSTCADLFSPKVVSAANSAGLVLNPEWAEGTDPGGLVLKDRKLAAVLADAPALDCRWLSPNGGSGVGIRSVIAGVDPDQAAWLNRRFARLGYISQKELGGTRYFFEARADGTRYGESHIVRDGVWFATHWLGYGPRGYTADMVKNYFE
jgi:hypothetical protein